MFQLNVLGSLSLLSDGAPMPPGALQKRRLGILAVLAIAAGRGMSRDRLQAYLWPESDSAKARHALDQLVYATRRAMDADPFISEGRDLRLNPAVVATDVARFEEAIQAARLEDAVNAYGGRLLYGIQIAESRDLESWLDSEASRLEQLYQKALETLACRVASAGDYEAAVTWRRKLALSDPLSSRFALGLIEELVKAGDAPGAIQHGRAYQNLVRAELEIEPDTRIEKLITSIAPRVEHHEIKRTPAIPHAAIDVGDGSNNFTTVDDGRSRRRRSIGFALAAVSMIALAIVAAIARKPDVDGSNAIDSRNETVDQAAQTAYLKGVNAWQDRSKSALDTAVVYFRKAIEIEPRYVEAQSGLANAYVMIGYSGYRPGDAMFPKAKAAALRAIQLDSTKAEPYAALGMELTWERDFKGAARAFRKSLTLDPNYATAHQWYGILLRIVGDIPGSVAETGKAAELDPMSLQIQNNYATFLSGSGSREAALRHYEKFVGEEPDSSWVRRNPWLLTNMASVYAANNRFDDALRFAERAAEILPGHPRAMSALAGVYRSMGKPDKARAIFDLSDKSNPHYAAYKGMFYAAEGKVDSAFLWFERVDDWGIPVLISLRGLNQLKADSRYNALLEKLGMNVTLD